MSAFGQWTRFTTKLKALLSEPDSLDTVELIMLLEETFGLNLDAILQDADSVRHMSDEIWLEVADKIPNNAATQLLKKIAVRDNHSGLESHQDEPWRKEQVEAVLRELLPRR